MMPFFSPPPLRTTAIWARLPDAFRKPHSNEWTRYNARGKALHSLLEGPALDAQGRLYVCDVPFGRIFRIDPDSREWTLVVQYDGWPNGLKVAADGTLYVADYKRGLLSIDPSTGRVTTLAARYLSEGLKGINDLCLTPSGDVLFTDQGQTGLQDSTGRVYRWSPKTGLLSLLLDGIPSPNGLAWDEQEQLLYVAATRSQQIWRVPVHAGDQVGKAGVFTQLHGGPGGPDGIALDGAGGLLVAHAGVGIVWHFDAWARPLTGYTSAAGHVVTNVCLAGPSVPHTLFITEAHAGVILQVQDKNLSERAAPSWPSPAAVSAPSI